MNQRTSFCRCNQNNCYHNGWNPLDDETWKEFHVEWWGSKILEEKGEKGKPLEDRVICISQVPVRIAFGLLEDTDGRLLLRDDVLYTYSRLQKAHRDESYGIILTGQTGSGVSVTGIVSLLGQMAEQKLCFFTSKRGQTFLMDKFGPWSIESSKFNYLGSGIRLHASTQIWSIVDFQDGSGRPISPQLFLPVMFPVYTVPPQKELYRHMQKDCCSHRWLLAPWTTEELLESLKLNAVFEQLPPHERAVLQASDKQAALVFVAEHVRQSGPFPRDLHKHLLSSRIGPREWVDTDGLLDLLVSPFVKPPSQYSHIILMNREQPSLSDDDICFFDFKSYSLYTSLAQRDVPLTMAKAEQFLAACPIVPESSLLGSWVLEALAVRYLCKEDFARGRHYNHPSAQMAPVPGQSARFRRRGSDGDRPASSFPADTGPAVLVMDGQGAKIYRNGHISSHGPAAITSGPIRRGPSSLSSFIPVKSRQIIVYLSLDQVLLDESLYFPLRRDTTLFDAFFFDIVSERKVVIWMIQVTTPVLPHDCISDGYDVVRALRRKFGTGWTVEVKYVLVVPQRPAWTVEWEMPPGWEHEDVRGDVYVQYLELDGFLIMRGMSRNAHVGYVPLEFSSNAATV